MKKSDREIMDILEAFDVMGVAHSAASLCKADPKTVAYQQTLGRLEAIGVRLNRVRLAVVFSRADLLPDHEGQPADEWAIKILGLGNLIKAARYQFGQVGFFRTASVLDDTGQAHASLGQLANWLLADPKRACLRAGPGPQDQQPNLAGCQKSARPLICSDG